MIEQVRPPHPCYHIGVGKAKELAEMVSRLGAEKVIFGNELKVVQVYNIAKLTGVEVIDRLQLILEIFLRRASTKEARLQIDLARLQYELAHAKEKVRLAKVGEQPGFHGLGKYDVDVYYETIRREVQSIQQKLKNVRKTRGLHRKRRRKLGFSLVSLAGYTNSGKSTLFNALTQESVPADPRLFTTISTTTRIVKLSEEKVLLTDTVGFIDKLPLTLIEAFRSTLEETIFSDLILLVVDVSEPPYEIGRKLSCCLETIREIGATGIPIVTVLNKIDLISAEDLDEKMKMLRKSALNLVPVSALYGINIDVLKEKFVQYLERKVRLHFTVPMNDDSLSLLSWIFENSYVHNVDYGNDIINVYSSASTEIAEKIKERVDKVGGYFRVEEVADLLTST
jgi:GTP-binding protein HflX